ncbi:hypothetical protein Tdes44962_MAKER03018 [Teratosphaeria destructans]|uniref:Uncharacterized protein n=1 Tax=Teratosphaeria destructans TaxID=418781 RepID=A0A9W7SRE8_9PEZI|nr:hypothetical protein Tdes44962_MAKER03018 [Teratosphaeria destructans]
MTNPEIRRLEHELRQAQHARAKAQEWINDHFSATARGSIIADIEYLRGRERYFVDQINERKDRLRAARNEQQRHRLREDISNIQHNLQTAKRNWEAARARLSRYDANRRQQVGKLQDAERKVRNIQDRLHRARNHR